MKCQHEEYVQTLKFYFLYTINTEKNRLILNNIAQLMSHINFKLTK